MTQVPSTENQPELSQWLKDNKLSQYETKLKEGGINSFQDLLTLLSESQMREVGKTAEMLPMDKYKFVKAIVAAKQEFVSYSETKIKEYFKSFDIDGDGLVSAEELKSGLEKIGQTVTEEQVSAMIKHIDSDGNGELDYEEFVKLFNIESSKVSYTTEELQAMWKEFDADGDGDITKEEFRNGLSKMGRQITNFLFDVMWKEIDSDGNGTLDFEEFKVLMNKQLTYTKSEIKKFYSQMDKDGDGTISSEELKEGFAKVCGIELNSEEIEKMLKEVDEDGNGELDFEEFTRLFA